MDFVWNSRLLPLAEAVDVAVVGLGPGGLGGACMAARAGRTVCAIEECGMPGGMASKAAISPFMLSASATRFWDAPIFTQWLDCIIQYLPEKDRMKQKQCTIDDSSGRLITPATAALAAEDMLLDSAVKLLYHARLVDVMMKDDTIDFLVIHTKSGFAAVKAKVYIDSTGDGDLAALAGVPFETGDENGSCQPMSVCFDLSNVEIIGKDVRTAEFQEVAEKVFGEAIKSGEITIPRENLLCFNTNDPHTVHFNTTRVLNHYAADGRSLSDAEIVGRRQLREVLAWLRRRFPGFADARLSFFGEIGVRESRRIRGLVRLTGEEITKCCRFPDAIARCNYCIDIHNPNGSGTRTVTIRDRGFYEIPYRALVPLKVRNLLIGSRCISGDVAAHSSYRVMPTVCSIGQAAGMAAAIAIEKGIASSDVNGADVRKQLIRMGANLN